MYEPSYIKLYQKGELENRVMQLNSLLDSCSVCPRNCAVNRNEDEREYCKTGRKAVVASYGDHHGEEPPLSGYYGSVTIFMGNCNLRCLFCQNYDISQMMPEGNEYEYSAEAIARIMLLLQDKFNCHNINFVSPTHVIPQIVEAVLIAIKKGLRIPLVYNSNGYDKVETLQLLDGIFDIYLPDLKYADNNAARKYSDASDYVPVARNALKEMFRQAGVLQKNKNGIAQRGLIIRHLIMPDNIAGTRETLKWIADQLSNEVAISLLAQYHPAHKAMQFPPLSRRINSREYNEAAQIMEGLGFKNQLYI